jgi:2-methylcitrate dehydratase PrpD
MANPEALSTQFAEHLAAFRLKHVPATVAAHARLVLLDTLGAMLAASAPKYSATRILREFTTALGGQRQASLVGQGLQTSCVAAALFNGTLGYYCDIEPYHVGVILHAPAVMVPASLAVAELQAASGAQFLEAVILGIEVACRVSQALDPVALYNRGFHPSAICGTFGAAAAAGRLFKLPAQRMAIALGLAMQQASGLLAWASDHTENSRPFNPGLAARNGVTAAYLASLGFGGPPTPFDGKYDAFTAFSGVRHADALLADWGTRWYLLEHAYKLYASCAFTHPGLDALLAIAREERVSAADLDEIVLRFPPKGVQIIDNNELRSHCAQYILPVGLVYGRVLIDDILQDRRKESEVARLSARTRMVPDEDLEKGWPATYASIVEVTTKDGRRFSRRVDHARGTPENPLAAGEILEKYLRLATTVTSPAHATTIADTVQAITRVPAISTLATLLRTLKPRRKEATRKPRSSRPSRRR